MKNFLATGLTLILIIVLAVCGLKQNSEQGYLRIHIRANSNQEADQTIKYEIKDEIVNFLTPFLVGGKTLVEAKTIISERLNDIDLIANTILEKGGFAYKAKAKLNNEYFPTRAYSELTLESGFYDALIVNLGSGDGDNWWCVVYPPLCFVSSSESGVIYRSKIIEIINDFFKNK